MPPPSLRVRIFTIRKRLELVRSSLLRASADSMEESIPGLAEAADALAALSEEISSHPAATGAEREKLIQEVLQLKGELSRVAALTAEGLEFCRKWSHVIQSVAGYLSSGEAAPVTAGSPTILLRG